MPQGAFYLFPKCNSYFGKSNGVHFTEPTGTEEELASLAKSYEHLCKMRDEIVELGIVPPVAEWTKMNPNL